MGKSFSGALCAVVFSLCLLGLVATSVQAAIVDSFDLNVRSSSGTNSNAVLQNGVEYTVEVSGTFHIGSSPLGTADAEYFEVPDTPIDATSIDIGVQINNVDIDWGAFNLTSLYSTTFFGLGNTALFSYADTFYGDNRGSLQVTISDNNMTAIPVPSTVLLLIVGLGLLSGRYKYDAKSHYTTG